MGTMQTLFYGCMWLVTGDNTSISGIQIFIIAFEKESG